jgi:hypothetical protein
MRPKRGGPYGAMHQFLEAAFGFPAAVFSFLLIVVIGYWLVVLLGLIDLDTPDGDTSDAGTGFLGLGGVPVGITFSFLVTFSWLGCLVGSVLLHRESVRGTLLTGLSIALPIGALVLAWMVTKLLIRPLRYMLPDEKSAIPPRFHRPDVRHPHGPGGPGVRPGHGSGRRRLALDDPGPTDGGLAGRTDRTAEPGRRTSPQSRQYRIDLRI